MIFALSLIVSFVLIATFEIVIFLSTPTPDIVPVKLAALTFDPCEPSSEWNVTSMPSARYTAEAERHGIAGTVILAAYFVNNGKVSRASVISGLPFGLTEQAIKATRQIKFKPATNCGRPGSEPVEIHYEFPPGQGTAIHL
jgi:protein TonB